VLDEEEDRIVRYADPSLLATRRRACTVGRLLPCANGGQIVDDIPFWGVAGGGGGGGGG
jgi:hypothetical protein